MSRKIILFGAGKRGEAASLLLGKNAEILFFVDNDASKWLLPLNGLEVRSPEHIKTLTHTGNVEIVITSASYREIYAQLDAMGIGCRRSVFDFEVVNYKQSEVMRQKACSDLIPKIFQIETVLGCNLRCPECLVGSGTISRAKRWMEFENFKIIADKIRPYAETVYLQAWGEPLVNPDIAQIIKYITDSTFTILSTNGMLVNKDRATALIESGIDQIVYSIDGTTQEIYEKYRVRGKLNRVLGNLVLLNDINVKSGNPVHISPEFLVFKHNEHQLSEFSDICEDIGLEPVFKEAYVGITEDISCSEKDRYRHNYLHENIRNCDAVRRNITILVDGTVVSCCCDYDGENNFGNIYSLDTQTIWSSSSYQRFRKSVMYGDIPDFCAKKCLYKN